MLLKENVVNHFRVSKSIKITTITAIITTKLFTVNLRVLKILDKNDTKLVKRKSQKPYISL